VPYFDQWGIVGGHTSAYRWHVNDPIVFEKSIRFTIEHFGWISPDENPENRAMSWNERQDDYSSVAFWYQTGMPTFTARAPHAKERRLPSLERVVAYARDGHTNGPGESAKQQLDLYEGEQVLYMPKEQDGAYLEIPFEVTKKEPLRLLLYATKSYDFGKWQAYLLPPPPAPGEKGAGGEGLLAVKLQGPFDLYSPDIVNEEVHLLDFWPEPGRYTLRLECVGKSPMSTGHYLGIESVRLRERRPRVFEMGWDKDKDWRKDPKLYG
jgi:hypothetical protein